MLAYYGRKLRAAGEQTKRSRVGTMNGIASPTGKTDLLVACPPHLITLAEDCSQRRLKVLPENFSRPDVARNA